MPFLAKNGISFDTVDEFSLAQYDPVCFDYYINQLDTIVQEIIAVNGNEYPGMDRWYDKNYCRTLGEINASLYDPGLASRIAEIRKRPFLLYINPATLDIVGVCLMKRTQEEEKISLIYVLPNYRGIGIAKDMLRHVSTILSGKPYIQLSENTFKRYPEFAKLLSHFGYTFVGRENTYDRDHNDEMYFTFKKKWLFFFN